MMNSGYNVCEKGCQVDYAQNVSGKQILGDDPDWSTSYSYDLGGNITGIKRKGASYAIPVFDNTAWGFGLIDDVTLQYDGNRLVKADDKCDELTYAGAMDFKDRVDKPEEYTYDANGNMTSVPACSLPRSTCATPPRLPCRPSGLLVPISLSILPSAWISEAAVSRCDFRS